MNNATTIHVKTDTKTRDEAKKVAEAFGFSLTSLVNAMLKQIARSKKLTLSLDETPNEAMRAGLRQGEEDVKAGRVISFKGFDEAIDYVSKLIDDDDKKRHSGH